MEIFNNILRKTAAVVMMMAVLCGSFSKLIVQIDYHFSKKYIASALCENRFKPKACCHGKCFLKKQLQKEEEATKNAQGFSNDKFDVALFFEEKERNCCIDEVSNKIFNSHYLLKKYSSSLLPVFHPPDRDS